jgi:hypothetical protein
MENRSDADYHQAMIEACSHGCTEVADHLLSRPFPGVDVMRDDCIYLRLVIEYREEKKGPINVDRIIRKLIGMGARKKEVSLTSGIKGKTKGF